MSLKIDKDEKMPELEQQTSVTANYTGYPVYYPQKCSHLLPCGICERTNKPCPLTASEPTWFSHGSCGGIK